MTETGAKADTELTHGTRKRSAVKKRLRILAGVVLIAVVLPPIVVPFCKRPWSEINCQHQDINIKAGQVRYSRYLWYVKISEAVKDSPISVALGGDVINVADIEPWHRVYTFTTGSGYSPNYRFHGALHQAREIELMAELNELGPEKKRLIAENVLKL